MPVNSKIVLLLLVGVILTAGCTRPHEVVVIEKTRSFHRAECARVNMAKVRYVELTSDVLVRYRPCPLCKPDTLL